MKWHLKYLEVALLLEQILEKPKMLRVKADFIHKFKISAKEVDELEY